MKILIEPSHWQDRTKHPALVAIAEQRETVEYDELEIDSAFTNDKVNIHHDWCTIGGITTPIVRAVDSWRRGGCVPCQAFEFEIALREDRL